MPASSEHVMYKTYEKRMTARKLLANSSEIILAAVDLVRRKAFLSSEEFLMSKEQDSIRRDINRLLENMRQSRNIGFKHQPVIGASYLPSKLASHTVTPPPVLKSSRATRYAKARVKDSQLQSCQYVITAMSGLFRRKLLLTQKIMRRDDSEEMKRELNTFTQTCQHLQSTMGKSTSKQTGKLANTLRCKLSM